MCRSDDRRGCSSRIVKGSARPKRASRRTLRWVLRRPFALLLPSQSAPREAAGEEYTEAPLMPSGSPPLGDTAAEPGEVSAVGASKVGLALDCGGRLRIHRGARPRNAHGARLHRAALAQATGRTPLPTPSCGRRSPRPCRRERGGSSQPLLPRVDRRPRLRRTRVQSAFSRNICDIGR